MLQSFSETRNFAKLVFGAVMHPTYFSFTEAYQGRGIQAKHHFEDWVGGSGSNSVKEQVQEQSSHLLQLGTTLAISKTDLGLRNKNSIIACGGWEGEDANLLFALLIEASQRIGIRFHHVGFEFKDDEVRKVAMDAVAKGNKIISSTTTGHKRFFIEKQTKLSPNDRYWIEYSQQENPPQRDSIHFDVATFDPQNLLDHLASHTGLDTQMWIKQSGFPNGKIFTVLPNNFEVAIHVRRDWGPPQKD
ncbi:MAG: hypothetical protein HGA25_04775 [Clostridiales bacterium]|nr:hypothetical protein [Clostridiales bacterium]